MSRDIEAWVASSSATPLDSEVDDVASTSKALDGWDSALPLARRHLLDSKLGVRLPFLDSVLLPLARRDQLAVPRAAELVRLLLLTVPRYHDSRSTDSVLRLVKALIESRQEPKESLALLEGTCKLVQVEVERGGAPTTRLTLLRWACQLFGIACDLSPGGAKDAPTTPAGKTIIGGIMAPLVDGLDDEGVVTRRSLRKSALVRVRRAIRESHEAVPALLEALTQPASPPRHATLIGIVVGVCLHLRAASEATKGAADGIGRAYVGRSNDAILRFWLDSILSARTAAPVRLTTWLIPALALQEPSVFRTSILPVASKMLLRSPEAALPALAAVLASTWPPAPLAQDVRTALIPPTLSAAKSSNPLTRDGAVKLVEALAAKSDAVDLPALATEIAAPLKTGKSASPEHRACLYAMLAGLPPTEGQEVVTTLVNALAKEGNEAALVAGGPALRHHLANRFGDLPSTLLATAFRALVDPKSPIRRTFANALGLAICDSSASDLTAAGPALAKSLETNLKNATTNPLAASGGPLEGYVAVAICFGPLASLPPIAALRKTDAVLQSVASGPPKPSFLWMERLYRRACPLAPEDGVWLAKASEAVFGVVRRAAMEDEKVKLAVAQAWVYLATECPFYETRAQAIKAIERIRARYPEEAFEVVIAGIRAAVEASARQGTNGEEQAGQSKGPRLRALLSSLLVASQDSDAVNGHAQDLTPLLDRLASAFVLSHHAVLDPSTGLWTRLVQTLKLDPRSVILERFEAIWDSVQHESTTATPESGMREAAYRALATMAFIAPEKAVQRIVAAIKDYVDREKLGFIGAEEYGIWRTPAGTTFVDVLAKKEDRPMTKNLAQRELEQWEAELRDSIERKKAGPGKTLTKEQKALVEAQLAKEEQIRVRVGQAVDGLRHGLLMVTALAGARTAELEAEMPGVVARMVEVVGLDVAVMVAGEASEAFRAVEQLCCASLSPVRGQIGLAVLRGLDGKIVKPESALEPLADLVTRVLYRIRTAAEQQAVDAVTYGIFAALVTRIIAEKGIGVKADDTEASMEQVALAVDVLAFAGPAASSVHDLRPRLIADSFVAITQHPQLAKAATSGLVAIGHAMADDASATDIACVLNGLLLAEGQARHAALQAAQPLDLTDLGWSPELWIAQFDQDDRNAALATELWAENGLQLTATCLPSLLALLEHPADTVRSAAARGLGAAAAEHRGLASSALQTIASRYVVLAQELVPEYDRFGMVIQESLDREDPWRSRVALADALRHLTPYFTESDMSPLFDLMIEKQSLGDRSEDVRSNMLRAGNTAIDLFGGSQLETLIKLFEGVLARDARTSNAADLVSEAAIIFLGRLARHLGAHDARLDPITERLIEALRTPSEIVQSAVSGCLPALVRLRKAEVPKLVERLLQETLRGASYAERRGGAYGLAGVVSGAGLSSLQRFSIVSRLKDALDDKKSQQARQGAVFAVEILSTSLGRLFEPYIIEMTSYLLTAFGDGATDVREATSDASRALMRGLSGHGTKLLLPSLLAGLDDKQWRAKKGSIELMGAMAYLAPQQLSAALPTIIPRLTEVLTDTHVQVRSAAKASLRRFGGILTNPEISAMQDKLLAALVDPARKTAQALEAVLGTAFVHFIDTSSLALIVPIIERGLGERRADLKRKATQIVGNLATLSAAKDLTPYLPQLLPKVRLVLIDPVPEARGTAAKALGSLVERMGEDSFPDLVPSLFDVLRADASGVDQQGAAQGLSEIMSGLGTDKLEELLPDIIANTSSPRAFVREGFISLLVFLPATYGDRFAPYLGRIIQPVLGGLADDSDYVRDASMRAGKMIVNNHSARAVDLLLPELERGLFDSSWRIRQSSIQLMGDLLFRIGNIAGKADVDEDGADAEELPSMDASRKAILDTLGKERRDRVLAAIYIIRQDQSGIVRSTSVTVWKALVQNTPRTVREIMPTLMQILVRVLASQGEEQRETAARTLGELVRKLGEGILGTIIQILTKAGTSEDVRTREGVSLAIIDVLESASKTQLEDHEDALIAIVRTALVDRDARVRTAAAQAFDSLQQQVGGKAVERTLPTLLSALKEPGEASEAALAALKELMRVRASSILPRLVPVLNKVPVGAFNARALATLVSVAGSAVNRYLSVIIDGLRASWLQEQDDDVRAALDESLRVIFQSIRDPDGLNLVMMHLLGVAKADKPAKRADGCDVFAVFCQSTQADFSEFAVLWVRQLVSLFEDRVLAVVDSAWTAMDEMVKSIPKDEMEPLVVPLRRSIESVGLPGDDLSGFCRPGGLKPVMPILLQGILSGTAEQREQAALAFGDIVERTSADFIKPFVTQITGPLIRIIGDRVPAPVKSAILHSLGVLLSRIPQFVKPFYPQLQRTFVKNLADPVSLTVRSRAISALGLLMAQQPRIDPLVAELVTGAGSEDHDDEIKEAYVLGLATVCSSGGKNIGSAAMASIMEFASSALEQGGKESALVSLAKLVGGIAKQRASELRPVLEAYIVPSRPSQISSLCIREILDQSPDAVYELDILADVVDRVVAYSSGGQPPSIARPAREAKELLKTNELFAYDEAVQSRLG